jgi:hypothetical protein
MGRAKEPLIEAREAERDHYIAGELHVAEDVLALYPFEIEENANDEGLVYSWMIRWDDGPPPGVKADSGVTLIPPWHSDDIDWPDDN